MRALLRVVMSLGFLGLVGGVVFSGAGCSRQVVLISPSPVPYNFQYAIQGSFSSAVQGTEDPDNFRDIRLEVRQIWHDLGANGEALEGDQFARAEMPDRYSVFWVYVEQAAAGSLDRPYRQRVYRFRPLDTARVWESTIYELPGDPLRFAGAHDDPSLLDGITPFDLIRRDGCEVILYYDSGELGQWTITGGTVSTRCASDWGGAAYATSEVTITEDAMLTWDRGFAADGTQVWGSTAGPYRFDRVGHDGR